MLRHFNEEDVKKIYSSLSAIRELKIKTTMRFQHLPTRMAKMK